MLPYRIKSMALRASTTLQNVVIYGRAKPGLMGKDSHGPQSGPNSFKEDNSRSLREGEQTRDKFLSQDELKAIHNASLQVLEKTGIKVMSKKVLDILGEAGAKVDYEKKSATIPANVVEEAVKRAPKTLRCCARNPRYDFMLDKKEVHFTTDGYAPFIRDFTSWQQAGSRSLGEVAKEKVREILATHKPTPLPEDVDREVCRILQRVETELIF